MRIRGLAAVAALSSLALAPTADAVDKVNTNELRQGVTTAGIMEHANAFQAIANANGGTRAAATSGYDASVEYVKNRLEAAGYRVTLSPFDFPAWKENQPSQLQQLTPTDATYANGTDFRTANFSGSGDLSAQIVPTNDVVVPPSASANGNTSGCEAEDFPADTAGNIALIQRGTCTFVTKINNAKAAGAAAVLIFNEGQSGRTAPIEISAPPYIGIPVLFTSFATGEQLYNADRSGAATARVFTDTTTTPRTQYNVIADSRRGDPDRTIVVGSHLDSVQAGPGINDNGSGSSTILEIAEEIAELPDQTPPRNRLRFAFWGAEEAGLIGSTEYVNSLSAADRSQIELNLNFDMVGSPNFVRFVYDGNTSHTPPPAGGAPAGSGVIEQVFLDYFGSQGLATDPTAFDGRSDYGPFIAQGIPAGGLFTGAEGIKTARQAEIYGGTAGVAFDRCYHQACDTLANLSHAALDQMSDAAAHATWTFARSKTTLGGEKPRRTGSLRYRGPFPTR